MRIIPAILVFFAAGFALYAQDGGPLVPPGAVPNIRISETEKSVIIEHLNQLNIPAESKTALAAMIVSAFTGSYLPPGVTVINGNYEAICARVVSRLFWTAFGNEDDFSTARGVSGDAWNMAANVALFGGRLFPWNENSASLLRTGDIIGIYYRYSLYNHIQKNRDYTHMALVVDNIPGRGPLLAHWWNIPRQYIPGAMDPPWFFRLEFLDDLLGGFPGFFIPREIIRPKNVFIGE
ncbi:MAG: hypothetical protein LBQ88_06210 [Treponema sp.]|jgi:hypothetical protein|nr:hypothetical protein [Treponema sp.]